MDQAQMGRTFWLKDQDCDWRISRPRQYCDVRKVPVTLLPFGCITRKCIHCGCVHRWVKWKMYGI